MRDIVLKPVVMTASIMQELEDRDLIIRLTPSREDYQVKAEPEAVIGKQIYVSEEAYGTHSLLYVSLNNSECFNFGSHPDNEEFLLLGGVAERKMFLIVSLLTRAELAAKIDAETLSAEDFVCLEAVFNDPEVSFFVMKKEVPHGECCSGEGLPVTFYVTEGSKLGIDKTDFKGYRLQPEY